MNTPIRVPEKGFYYHYKKHDPAGLINNYAYEVIGVGLHTELRDHSVLYRPLYKNTFLSPADYCVRPFEMFMGSVDVDGKVMPRFQKIVDPQIISELKIIRDEMYPNRE